MANIRIPAIAAALALTAIAGCGRNARTVADTAARARSIVDAAVAAHGGEAALQKARHIRITLEGEDYWRNQSANVAPPYDARPSTLDVMVNLDSSRVVSRSITAYPGGVPFTTRRVTDGEKSLRVFETAGVHRAGRAGPIETQMPQLFPALPQLVLLVAAENRASLQSLGQLRLSSGAMVDAVSMSTGNGVTVVGFDPATRLVRALLDVNNDPVAGDVSVETEFLDYRAIGDVLLPSRRIQYTAGERTQELRYTGATPGYAIPDSLFAIPPASKVMAEPPGDPVQEIAPDVWSIRQFGAHVLAVAFREYVVVIEAPGGSPAAIMAEVAKVAPGKAVRYIVPTHHHDDHSSGVREYAAAGATIVTTPGNRAYFERMIAARSTLEQNANDTARRAPLIETLANRRRIFTDGTRTLEIHDIGPNEHATEMIVAWIPEAGILYEADMFITAPNGDIVNGVNHRTTVDFAEEVRKRAWNVRLIAGMHHPPLPLSVLTAIAAQPVR